MGASPGKAAKAIPPIEIYRRYWEKNYGPIEGISEGEIPENWHAWAKQNFLSPTHHAELQERLFSTDVSLEPNTVRSILTPFCTSFAYLTEKESTHCKKDPSLYFHYARFIAVEEVDPDQDLEIKAASRSTIDLLASFFQEHTDTKRLITADKKSAHSIVGIGSNAGYNIMGNGFGLVSAFNREKEWYDIEESATGSRKTSRVSTADKTTLSREEITLTLPLRTRFCQLIRPNIDILQTSLLKKQPVKTFLLCSAPQKTFQNWEESWYLLNEWSPTHSLTDHKAPAERGWTKLIRGKKNFDSFFRLFRNPNREFHFKKVDPYIDGVDTFIGKVFSAGQQARFDREGGVPGVLYTTETSPLRWTESQVRHYVAEAVKGAPGNAQWVEWLAACFFENAARKMDHAHYLADAKAMNAKLIQEGIPSFCKTHVVGRYEKGKR
jgi:hypothetical protein